MQSIFSSRISFKRRPKQIIEDYASKHSWCLDVDSRARIFQLHFHSKALRLTTRRVRLQGIPYNASDQRANEPQWASDYATVAQPSSSFSGAKFISVTQSSAYGIRLRAAMQSIGWMKHPRPVLKLEGHGARIKANENPKGTHLVLIEDGVPPVVLVLSSERLEHRLQPNTAEDVIVKEDDAFLGAVPHNQRVEHFIADFKACQSKK